jgi:hypothetical protein
MGGDVRIALVILAFLAGVGVLMLVANLDRIAGGAFGVELSGLFVMLGIGTGE